MKEEQDSVWVGQWSAIDDYNCSSRYIHCPVHTSFSLGDHVPKNYSINQYLTFTTIPTKTFIAVFNSR